MKVFISWSGAIGEKLREWLPMAVPAVKRRWRALAQYLVCDATFLWVFLAVLVCVVTTYVLWWLKQYRSIQTPMPGENPDASVMISTFIIIYTSFIAAYAALTTELRGSQLRSSQLASLILMLGAVGLDLWRILNSTGDLLSTTMRGLTRVQAMDAERDFNRYLWVNMGVLVFALLVACLRGPIGKYLARVSGATH